jgi:hypothetical protein
MYENVQVERVTQGRIIPELLREDRTTQVKRRDPGAIEVFREGHDLSRHVQRAESVPKRSRVQIVGDRGERRVVHLAQARVKKTQHALIFGQ